MSGIPERLMSGVLRIAPEHRREWAEAMAAELGFVRGGWSRWQWSVGCALSILREAIGGGVRGALLSGAEEETMRKFSLGAALVSLAVFFVLMFTPMFRQALKVGGDAWMSRDLTSPAQMQAIVSEARQKKDAELLAWAAMRYENPDRVEVAQEAVALDKQYTWIYYTVCETQMARPEAACPSMIQALKQWAPDNAVPWLMEAALVRPRFAYPPKDAPPTDPGWIEAMDRAFASPSYDSYRMQRILLERDIYKRGYMNSPILLSEGVVTQPVPDFRDLQWQARRLSASDPVKVTAFAAVMERGSQSEIESIFANGLVGARRGQRLFMPPSGTERVAFATVSAVVIQYSILALTLGIVLVLAALLAKLVHGVARGNWLSVEFTEICGVVGATTAGLSSLAVYVAYLPYSKVLETFLQARERGIDERSLWIFFALTDFAFWQGHHDQAMEYVWMSVVVVGIVSLVWMVGRGVVSRRA